MITKLLVGAAVAVSSLFIAGTTGYKVGDAAADFKLKNIDQKMVSLSDYKDAKGFFVVFTCNHCPYAKAYESRIIALDKKYKPLGYPVIAINPNDPIAYPADNYENMQKNAKEKGFTFPYLIDETQATAKAYGALKTPHIYILKKENNKLIVKYIGAIDNNYEDENATTEKYVENAMTAIMAGKTPEKQETKAVGCGIKWKE